MYLLHVKLSEGRISNSEVRVLTEFSDWLTTAEAAQLVGYHVERIRELVRDGKIQGRKFGPVWAVNRQSLLDYIREIGHQGRKRGRKSILK